MKHLGTLLNKENVIAALEFALAENPKLRPGTGYALVYKGRHFPPKEIARIAAQKGGLPKEKLSEYRLQGGPRSINPYFEQLGFNIVPHSKTDRATEHSVPDKSKRIARLCWNDKRWVRPSGWKGKSEMENSHEAQYGYGHEEWLFDVDTLALDGFHYGFVECIRENIDLYAGQIFDVRFFSINGETKQRVWAGRIRELQVLNKVDADKIRRYYESEGWLQSMENEIRALQKRNNKIKNRGWSEFNGLEIFNVRFRPGALDTTNLYTPIPQSNPLYKKSRYAFILEKPELLEGATGGGAFSFIYTDEEIPEMDEGALLPKTRVIPDPIEINQLHEVISRKLTKKLREEYGKRKVQRNHPANFLGREIDIVVDGPAGFIFYEIKTYTALIQSVRVAIGQLLEYAHWCEEHRACQLILVTQRYDDMLDGITYIRYIRKKYNLPFLYQYLDLKTGELSEPY